MMTCDRVVDRIDEFLMDLLPPDARDGVEAHLGTCASCGRALAKARATWGALHEWQPRPPASRKTTRRALPKTATPPWAPALAIAGAILVMVALAIVYHGRHPAVQPEVYVPPTAHVEAPTPPPAEKPIEVPAPVE